MAHTFPQFSRSKVDRSGRVLLDKNASEEEWAEAMLVVSNWRSAHAFPLNTIYVDMKRKANRVDSDPIAAQRLKRQSSLIAKLAREPSMRLTQMQDIGGCRTVLKSLKEVEQLSSAYRGSQAEHEFVEADNYILQPKESGYRSLHLVYRYKSKTLKEYNGLLFEVQIRTRLQHAWATAVETVGAVLGQSLKSSEGQLAWLQFFRWASAAFAVIEKSSLVPGVSNRPSEIAGELEDLLQTLDVETTLGNYSTALRATESPRVKDAAYFLLVLKPEDPTLEIYAYKKGDLAQAYADYSRFEQELPKQTSAQLSLFPEFADYSGAQAVLVGAQSFRSLRQSYPNYYLDTDVFVKEINGFIRRYRR